MSTIPDAALGQHIAVLGKTGSGKTFAIKGIIEDLLAGKKRVAIIDPTGAWWGLRSSRDGKHAGFPILVLGGDHGDLPLPARSGTAVASLLVDGVNLVADTSLLTVGERTRWFIDFANSLYRTNRAPLHLVIDEAHNFAPQGKVPDPDTGKMLHAANTLASGGRSRGIRLTMITQRPAKLHKDSLTCADTLIAMRVLAPQDRTAVEDWIKGCGDLAQGKEVLNSLASLKRGEGWVWYPEGAHLERIKFPPIKTFDSSATPTDGHELQAPKGVADIDLTQIKAAMSEAVLEAEANDPKLLRARIAELERECKKHSGAHTPTSLNAEYTRGRVDGFDAGRVKGRADVLGGRVAEYLQQTRTQIHGAAGTIDAIIEVIESLQPIDGKVHKTVRNIPEIIHQFGKPLNAETSSVKQNDQFAKKRNSASSAAHIEPSPLPGTSTKLPSGERAILAACIQFRGCTREQLTVMLGFKRSTRDAYIQRLRERAMVKDEDGEIVSTQFGRTTMGSAFEALPTGEQLQDYWLDKLPEGERKILTLALQAYPTPIERSSLDGPTGFKRSTRDAYIQRLVARQIVKPAGRSSIVASGILFE